MSKKILTGIILLGALFAVAYFTIGGNSFSNKVPDNAVVSSGSPKIVELKNGDIFDLTATIIKKNILGKEIKMLAYNGTIPGPVIRVQKGSEITLNFKNETGIPTTVHSHGLRLENKYDGVPDLTQKEVRNKENFTYKIKFPDEGVYWYHPHIREDYAQELGLYGNYIVVSDDPNYWNKVNREEVVTLDDILLNENGPEPFGKVANYSLMGRYGNVFLINGTDSYGLGVKAGEVVRFYFTNTANTRVFNISIPGVKMKVVGSDNGRYEKEFYSDSVLLGPSERAVVEAYFPKAGKYSLIHKTPEHQYILGNIGVAAPKSTDSFVGEFDSLRQNSDIRKVVPNIEQYFSKKDDKSISFTIDMGNMGMSGMHMMPDGTMMSNSGMMMHDAGSEKIEWEDSMAMMNASSLSSVIKWKIVDEITKKENMHIDDWDFKKGDMVKIKIYNDPKSMHPMQHPIHFHGQRFLVLTTNGIKNNNMVWKDTTLIQKGDTVEILLEASNPGMWMAHCHIAEHLESGMMFEFRVE